MLTGIRVWGVPNPELYPLLMMGARLERGRLVSVLHAHTQPIIRYNGGRPLHGLGSLIAARY